MDAIILKDRVTGSMTDEEFLWFCQENKDLRIERNSNLEIIIMSPVTTRSNYGSGAAFAQLYLWNSQQGKGLVFDSSTGFTLPDRSVFSPDACWVSTSGWNALSDEDKDRFAPICPEFIIEVRSKSDSLEDLQNKMHVWIKNGAQSAWLIDTREKVSYLYHPEKEIRIVKGLDKKLIGEGLVTGFELDLSLLSI
ncbi:MAG: Uma2 family endonuclease [Cyclobacteriaceae bacterium]|nr:Uma2 family endonuclease [Cyclobacteriaceae bacterium]